MLLKKRFKFCEPLNLPREACYLENEIRQLKAAWSVISEGDRPMVPAIISNLSQLKISLVFYVSKTYLDQDVFIQYLSKDDVLEDLFYLNKKEGVLSPLMSAITLGQTVAFYPVGDYNQKVFSHLSPIFSGQGQFLSYENGKGIIIPETCRFVVLLNEENFQYQLSREHQQLLSPKIHITHTSSKALEKYLKEKKGVYQKELVDYVMSIFDEEKSSMSLEEVREILIYSSKLYEKGENSCEEVVEEVISLMQQNKKRVGNSHFLKLGHE